MRVRRATPEDASQIAAIYYQTIHHVNAADYTPEQLEAWAPAVPETEQWRERMASLITIVADDGGTVTGFGELETDGHVDCFYCHHEYLRRGVGSAILAELEKVATEQGITRLYLESSLTARPFFEARGFVVEMRRDVEVRGQALENYVMEKGLPGRLPVSAEQSPGRQSPK